MEPTPQLPFAQEDSTLTSTFEVATGAAGAGFAATGAAAQDEEQPLEQWLLLSLPRRLPQPPRAKLSEATTPAITAATTKTKLFFILTSKKKFLLAPMANKWHLAN